MRMGGAPGCGLYITILGSYRSGVGQRDFAENESVRLPGSCFREGVGGRSNLFRNLVK